MSNVARGTRTRPEMTDQGVTQGGERDIDGTGVASGFHHPTEAMLLPCIRTRRLGFLRIKSPAPQGGTLKPEPRDAAFRHPKL